jgi:hypothetical protein
LAIGRDASTPRLPHGGRLSDDDERRAARCLPLGVEHLPRAAEVLAGRRIERDHAAISRIEGDRDLVVVNAALHLERQHEAEQDRAALLELAAQIAVRARDGIRLEAARAREVAERAELDAALRRGHLAHELVEGPLMAPRTRDHRERGEAAIVLRPLADDRRRRGAQPAGVERGGLHRAGAAGVRQSDTTAGQRDQRDQHEARHPRDRRAPRDARSGAHR